MRREVFYLDAPDGGRFTIVTKPAAAAVGSLLYVPPFAEELNKSRRMVALAARDFAAHGWNVLQMDLFGCGDSAGDFGDAAWDTWLDDVGRGFAWLQANAPGPVVLWSVRAGSLLVADWLERSGQTLPLLLWQPVTNGKQHLTQFLRLKAANEMLADADANAAMKTIRSALQRGEYVEIAGYSLSPRLAAGLDAAALRLPPTFSAPVAILEVSGAEKVAASPAARMLVEAWGSAGVPVRLDAVAGPSFWQTQEIETAPALITRSLDLLKEIAA